MKKDSTKFPSAGIKFEDFFDFWQGDSGEMECGSVSDYSDDSKTTVISSQNSLTGGFSLLVLLRTH